MTSNPTLVREDVHIDAFDSGRRIHGINWHDSIPECWRNMHAGAPQTLLVEVEVRVH
jgi:hypothetical protein